MDKKYLIDDRPEYERRSRLLRFLNKDANRNIDIDGMVAYKCVWLFCVEYNICDLAELQVKLRWKAHTHKGQMAKEKYETLVAMYPINIIRMMGYIFMQQEDVRDDPNFLNDDDEDYVFIEDWEWATALEWAGFQ